MESEKVYVRNTKDAIRFRENSPVLFLIQQIRDEAHRFAITYHKQLRKKSGLRSMLDEIPGIGEKRKKALLTAFGSLKRLKEASVDELASVKGMSRRAAENLYEQINTDTREKNDESV